MSQEMRDLTGFVGLTLSRPPLRLWTLVAAIWVVGSAGCGQDPSSSTGPVDTLCSGAEQRCDGNALLTCADAGKAWTVGWCGESKTCTASGGAPGCVGVKCERGSLRCDGNKVLTCSADGLSEPNVTATCKSDEQCLGGACVPTACKAGAKQCGWRSVLTCESGAWARKKCAADERCDETSAACVKRTCKPTEVRCGSATTAQTCDVIGSAWVDKACAKGQVCTDGVCHAKVKGATTAADAGPAVDAGGASDGGGGFIDVGKKDTQLEAFDTLHIVRSSTATPGPEAEKINLDFTSADYSSVTKMLQITGSQGLLKLEIQIAPVEELTTGNFTALEAQAEDTAILMNDGSNAQDKVQWQYQSVDYTLTLTAFDDVGGRIKGTFSAKLGDAINKGKFVYVQGNFDIKRTN